MTRWFATRVLAIGLPVIEIVLIIWVAALIGWGWTLVLLLAGFAAGLALMRAAGITAFQALRAPMQRRQPYVEIDETTGVARTVHPATAGPSEEEITEAGAKLRESGLLFVAGALLAIPGFLSDIAGLLLALPWVRRQVAARLPQRSAESPVVVQGETVVVDTDGQVFVQTWGTTEPSEPPVIRGEILPPPRGGE